MKLSPRPPGALALAPQHLPALTGAAAAAVMAGQLGAAEGFWVRAAAAAKGLDAVDGQASPLGDILSALTTVYLLSGKWVSAIEGYQDLLAVQLSSVEAWVGIGLCFRESDRPQEAVAAFQRAISADKAAAEAALAELLPSVEKGRRWLQRTRVGSEPPMPAAQWVEFLSEANTMRATAGKLKQTVAAYRRIVTAPTLASDEGQSDAWNQLGLTLLKIVAESEETPSPGSAAGTLLAEARLRRGPSVILPPSFSFIWRIPIVTRNASDE